jgi:hypothetical protein
MPLPRIRGFSQLPRHQTLMVRTHPKPQRFVLPASPFSHPTLPSLPVCPQHRRPALSVVHRGHNIPVEHYLTCLSSHRILGPCPPHPDHQIGDYHMPRPMLEGEGKGEEGWCGLPIPSSSVIVDCRAGATLVRPVQGAILVRNAPLRGGSHRTVQRHVHMWCTGSIHH